MKSDPRRLAVEVEDALAVAFRQLRELADRDQTLASEAIARASAQLAVNERRAWGDHREPTVFHVYTSPLVGGDA